MAVAALNVALVGGCANVTNLLEKHGGVYEKFGDYRDGVFEPFFEKDFDEIRILDILFLFVYGLCCFWLAPSASSLEPAPPTAEVRKGPATEAAYFATLHRPLLRRAGGLRTYRQNLHYLLTPCLP